MNKIQLTFPFARIAEVTVDGGKRFVVYSDASSVALILGMGNTVGTAIKNARANTLTMIAAGVA